MSYKEDVWKVKNGWQKDFWAVSEGPVFSPYYTYPEERRLIEKYMKQFKK